MTNKRKVALLALSVVIALGVLVFPSIRSEDVQALTAHEEIAIVGNSVIKTPSKCDTDSRGMAEMLAEKTGRRVADLSRGGQTLDQSIQLAALALRNPNIRSVVVPLIVSSRLVSDSFDLQSWIFYRALNPNVPPAPLMQRISEHRVFEGEAPVNGAPFIYKGTAYPDYNGVKAQYFSREHDAMTCPENEGRDLRFVEAYYHFVYRAPGISDGVMRNIRELQAEARAKNKAVLFIVMPVNIDILDRMLPSVSKEVQAEALQIKTQLVDQGLNVVDLVNAVRAPVFADAWCACGHMQQAGRIKVVEAASSALMQMTVASDGDQLVARKSLSNHP